MNPMKSLIARLFRDSKEINNLLVVELRKEQPANNTFLECQLVLKSGYAAAGVLTTTSEDMLRMTSIAQTSDKKVAMVDQYFSYEDVETVVVDRGLPDQLVKPVRNGGPIILGH